MKEILLYVKNVIINTDCTSEYSQNGTNCYQICKYLYYFDLNKIHHCTENDECPSDFPNKIVNENKCVEKCIEGKYIKLIVDKKECVEKCIDEYKFEFDNKCYKECPDGTYYNYTQDGCIDYIPPGYYLNDSLKRTIDKCDIKCENECTLDERNIVICKECNNKMKYYKKEDEEEKNGYYDCYTGEIEKYFLDNNEYKKILQSIW